MVSCQHFWFQNISLSQEKKRKQLPIKQVLPSFCPQPTSTLHSSLGIHSYSLVINRMFSSAAYCTWLLSHGTFQSSLTLRQAQKLGSFSCQDSTPDYGEATTDHVFIHHRTPRQWYTALPWGYEHAHGLTGVFPFSLWVHTAELKWQGPTEISIKLLGTHTPIFTMKR